MLKKLTVVAQACISLFLLFWVISLVPLQSWKELAEASVEYIFLATFFMFFAHILAAYRLYALLVPLIPRLQYNTVLKSTLLGYFCSSFLPSSVGGDIVKWAWLKQMYGSGIIIFSGMLAERVINFLLTVLFAVLMLAELPAELSSGNINYKWAMLLALFAIAGIALIWVAIKKTPWKWTKVLHGLLLEIRDVLSFWRRFPLRLFYTLGLSLLVILCAGIGGIFSLALSVGAEISVWHAMGCISIATLFSLIPITINGIGVYEALLTGILIAIGCSPEQSAQVAILMRVVAILSALPGAYWLRFAPQKQKNKSLQLSEEE